MFTVAGHCSCSEDDLFSANSKPTDLSPLSPNIPITPSNTLASGITSPVSTRAFTEATPSKEKEGSNMQQQIMSLLSFTGSRHQSATQTQQASQDDTPPTPSVIPRFESSPKILPVPDPIETTCRGVAAATVLIDIFCDLSFGDNMSERQGKLAIQIFIGYISLSKLSKAETISGTPAVLPLVHSALERMRVCTKQESFHIINKSAREDWVYGVRKRMSMVKV